MNNTIIYLSGFENQFANKEHLTNFIISQCITEAFSKVGVCNTKLTFEEGKLIKYELIDEGIVSKTIELQQELLGLPLPACTPQSPSIIKFTQNGFHTMDGKYPENFCEPDHNGTSPLVYVGCISKQDQMFHWLPFDLHIAFPIYANVVPLYFDYTNPEKPVLINVENFNTEHSNFEPHITKKLIIEFESAKFNFAPSNSIFNADGSCFGHTGVPCYSQTNLLPKSPKTGKLMPFVCQLFGGVKMKNCDIVIEEAYYQKDLKALNFWSDAWLFIYFEPETKIMCALISH